MLRSMLAAAAAAAALSLGVLPAPVRAAPAPGPAPTTLKPKPDPLAGLALHPEWGTVTGRSGVLKRGCHKYGYTYSITPPEGIWAIEVYISGPRLKHLAAGAFLDGYDPKNGRGVYKLCRATTRYGTFTIEAKLSADDGSGHITEGRLPADTFKLHRRR